MSRTRVVAVDNLAGTGEAVATQLIEASVAAHATEAEAAAAAAGGPHGFCKTEVGDDRR